MNEQEIAERIIALDEQLDQVILARADQLATEFSNDPEEKRRGALPKAAGAAALIGAGAYGGIAGGDYLESAARRGRQKVGSGTGAFGQGSQKKYGMRKVIQGDLQKTIAKSKKRLAGLGGLYKKFRRR